MEITLEKIDVLRERTGVSYRRAREVLEATGGDLVQALIQLEEETMGWQERINIRGSELVDKVKDLLHEGNVRRVVIKQDGRTLLEIPVTLGAIGALFLPTVAALGVVAAMVSSCTIVVERRGDRTVRVAKDQDKEENDPVYS